MRRGVSCGEVPHETPRPRKTLGSAGLEGGEEAGQEGDAVGHRRDLGVLVVGVGAVAGDAEAVEGRDAKGGAHSDDEFVLVDTLVDRARLDAGLVERIRVSGAGTSPRETLG